MTVCKIGCASADKYDKLVQVFAPPTAPNEFGEVDTFDLTKWNKIGSVYCTVRTGTAREVWKAREQESEVTAVFEAAYSSFSAQITGRHMLKINGQNYFIIGAHNEDENNVQVIIWCRSHQVR